MPDLTFLNNLSPLFQIMAGLGFGLMAAYLYLKAKADQKKADAVKGYDFASPEARVRLEGPIAQHLELMKVIAAGFTHHADFSHQVKELRDHIEERMNRFDERLRESERFIDRNLPQRRRE